MERNEIQTLLTSLGFTMTVEFIPYSKVSEERKKSFGDNNPTFNYRVTIARNKRTITTDYTLGCGHSPSYRDPKINLLENGYKISPYYRTTIINQLLAVECEYGKQYGHLYGAIRPIKNAKPILPTIEDVLHSLLLDYDVLNHPTFESWAEEFGYDTDSRKVEKTYRACLQNALAFRPMIADCEETLRDAFQDF